MTKEELKQEAEKSLDKRLGTYAYIRKQDCYTNYVDGYIDSAEPREKRIAELEQENKRLTDELKSLRESIKDYGAGCYENGLRNGKRKLEEQLTKAKEIIREFVEWATWQGSNCPSFKSIQDKAEQFLKE